MLSELQGIADALHRRLRRSVMIDDPRLRMLVVSDHPGDVDPLRVYTVLHHTPPPDAIEWVTRFDIDAASGPTRITPNDELGIAGRVCIPIKWKGALLGYLWLMEIEGPLSPSDIAAACRTADEAATVMHRQRLVELGDRTRLRQLGAELTSDQRAVREHAADRLVHEGMFDRGETVVAVVVHPWHLGGEWSVDAVTATFGAAVEAELAVMTRHGRIGWVSGDHAVVVSHGGPDTREDAVDIAAGLAGTAERALGSSNWRCIVGVGEVQGGLEHTHVTYSQALRAARIGATVGTSGPVVRWSDLGIYAMFATLDMTQLTSDVLHPGFLRLVRHRDSAVLVRTVERFLDRAGDVQRTAADLFLHRGTLYNRLHKVERVAGLSLDDGKDRLALHLSIKLARLAGVLPWTSEQRDAESSEPAATAT